MIFKRAVLFAITAALIFFFACVKESFPTLPEKVKENLINKTWSLNDAQVDNTDQTGIYRGLTIRFSDSTYTTTNGKAMWPTSGTWEFINADASVIKRDDGLEMQIEITDTTLKLTFIWNTTSFEPGRNSSVKGSHIFLFNKM